MKLRNARHAAEIGDTVEWNDYNHGDQRGTVIDGKIEGDLAIRIDSSERTPELVGEIDHVWEHFHWSRMTDIRINGEAYEPWAVGEIVEDPRTGTRGRVVRFNERGGTIRFEITDGPGVGSKITRPDYQLVSRTAREPLSPSF